MTWFAVVRPSFEGMRGGERLASRVPVGAFADRAAADARAADLAREARRTLNPFEVFGEPSGADFTAAVAGLGIAFGLWPPPDFGDGCVEWDGWYDAVQDELTDADRAAVWDLVARGPLYEVRELDFVEE